jgi:hypothetical protein
LWVTFGKVFQPHRWCGGLARGLESLIKIPILGL